MNKAKDLQELLESSMGNGQEANIWFQKTVSDRELVLPHIIPIELICKSTINCPVVGLHDWKMEKHCPAVRDR